MNTDCFAKSLQSSLAKTFNQAESFKVGKKIVEKDFHLRGTPTQNLLKKDLKTARILFKILEILMQDDHEH